MVDDILDNVQVNVEQNVDAKETTEAVIAGVISEIKRMTFEKLNRGHRRGIQDGGPELGRYLLPSVCAGLRVISSGGGLPIRRSEKMVTR